MTLSNKETNKKLRIIKHIDEILEKLDKPESLYAIIADTLSLMQLKAIEGELLEELKLNEETTK